jgi:hypothetical protein
MVQMAALAAAGVILTAQVQAAQEILQAHLRLKAIMVVVEMSQKALAAAAVQAVLVWPQHLRQVVMAALALLHQSPVRQQPIQQGVVVVAHLQVQRV